MFPEPTNNPLVWVITWRCDECETEHDHSNVRLNTWAVENIVIFCESAELFQNLENVNSLAEKKEYKMRYEKLK